MANLVGEWKFDGSGIADGGNADTSYTKDTWGTNNGTITGTPVAYSGTNCVYNSCLQFTGASYLNVGNNTSLNIQDSVSMGLWIKSTVSSVTGWLNFINTNSAGNCDSGSYCMRWNAATVYANFYTGSSSSNVSFNQSLINDNNWHYLTAVYNGTNTYYYVDSQLRSTGSLTGQLRSLPGSVLIGNPSSTYTETLDDVRIYSAAIPSSQIKEIYSAGLRRLLAKQAVSKEYYKNKISSLVNNFAQN